MATVGTLKQENKINELAEIVEKKYPKINKWAIKGALRNGANAAIEESHFSEWAEMSKQEPYVRKDFFNSMVEEARPSLEKLLGKKDIDDLIQLLKQENEKYVGQ
jgi:hypothetical protein